MEVKLELAGGGGRCRCCYGEVEGGKRLDEQYTCGDTKEVYSSMLKETFSLTLSQAKCDHICERCVDRLRDASSFKKLVLDTEQRFLQLLPGCSKSAGDTDPEAASLPPGLVLKIEAPDESVVIEEVTWDTDFLDTDDYIDEPISPKIEKVKKEPRKPTKASGVFKPVAKTVENLLKQKSKQSKTSAMTHLARLLSNGAGDKRSVKLSNSINTLKTLVGQPLCTTRSVNALSVKAVTGKLLNASKSSALVSKLLSQRASEAGPKSAASKSSLNVDSILKALRCKKTPLLKIRDGAATKSAAVDSLHRKVALPLHAPYFERRTERQILKHNVIALVKHTTICPFVNHRGNFRCYFCTETFFKFDLLREHVVEMHGDAGQASRGIYTFKDILHVDITDLKCRRCQREFPDVETIKDHLVKDHKVKINLKHKDDVIQFKLLGSNTFKCHLCDEEFHVFRNLSLHMNVHFPNYMCDVCGKAFISARRCQSHDQTHTTGTYPCSKCDKVFHSTNSRNAHTLEHRVTKYRCLQCPERFNKYLERTIHMSEVHNVTQKFSCPHPECGKEFIHKPQLSAHVRTHSHKEKKVECSECGMRFINNYSLAKHVVSHTGERPFQCKICGKKYGRKNTLREHMRIHENDRRHVCPECGQGFVQKCSLNGHIKSRHPHAAY